MPTLLLATGAGTRRRPGAWSARPTARPPGFRQRTSHPWTRTHAPRSGLSSAVSGGSNSPVGDELVLGDELGKLLPRDELHAADQLAVIDVALGEVLVDDVDGDLPIFDQIEDIAAHARRLCLFPLPDRQARSSLLGDRVIHRVAAQDYGVLC